MSAILPTAIAAGSGVDVQNIFATNIPIPHIKLVSYSLLGLPDTPFENLSSLTVDALPTNASVGGSNDLTPCEYGFLENLPQAVQPSVRKHAGKDCGTAVRSRGPVRRQAG